MATVSVHLFGLTGGSIPPAAHGQNSGGFQLSTTMDECKTIMYGQAVAQPAANNFWMAPSKFFDHEHNQQISFDYDNKKKFTPAIILVYYRPSLTWFLASLRGKRLVVSTFELGCIDNPVLAKAFCTISAYFLQFSSDFLHIDQQQ